MGLEVSERLAPYIWILRMDMISLTTVLPFCFEGVPVNSQNPNVGIIPLKGARQKKPHGLGGFLPLLGLEKCIVIPLMTYAPRPWWMSRQLFQNQKREPNFKVGSLNRRRPSHVPHVDLWWMSRNLLLVQQPRHVQNFGLDTFCRFVHYSVTLNESNTFRTIYTALLSLGTFLCESS